MLLEPPKFLELNRKALEAVRKLRRIKDDFPYLAADTLTNRQRWKAHMHG